VDFALFWLVLFVELLLFFCFRICVWFVFACAFAFAFVFAFAFALL
jgi:hypothetical protein